MFRRGREAIEIVGTSTIIRALFYGAKGILPYGTNRPQTIGRVSFPWFARDSLEPL